MQVTVYVRDLHVHQVHMNNLVRILRRLERAGVRCGPRLGNVARLALDLGR